MNEVNYNILVSVSKKDCQVLIDYWKNLTAKTQDDYDIFKESEVVYKDFFDADLIDEQKKRYAERISECLDNAEKWLERSKSFNEGGDKNLRSPQNLHLL